MSSVRDVPFNVITGLMFHEETTRILSRVFEQLELPLAQLVLDPKLPYCQVADLSAAKASAYPDCRSGVGIDLDLQSHRHVLPETLGTEPFAHAFENAS